MPATRAGTSLTWREVAEVLDGIAVGRRYSKSTSVDNGTELCSKATDAWTHWRGVQPQSIRSEKPSENAFTEGFDVGLMASW